MIHRFGGASPPFVLLHGFTGSGADFESFAPCLGHQAFAPDLPGVRPAPGLAGVGGAPSPAGARELCMHDVVGGVLATLEGLDLERPILLGYSMGGRVALHAARGDPERFAGLVLIGASPGLRTEQERTSRRADDAILAARILSLGVEAFLGEWEALPIIASQARIDPDVRAHMRARRLATDPHDWAGCLRGLGTGSQPSLWDELGQVTLPTLLLTGSEDAKFGSLASSMQAALPDAVHVTIPGAGHCAHLEQPSSTAAAILAWLKVRCA